MAPNDQLLAGFVTESKERLADISADLLLLERGEDTPSGDVVNRLFRSLHTIKGNAGFFELAPMVRLGHAAETLLDGMRDKRVVASTEVVDALLRTVDKLTEMFDDLSRCGAVSIESLVVELGRLNTGTHPEHYGKAPEEGFVIFSDPPPPPVPDAASAVGSTSPDSAAAAPSAGVAPAGAAAASASRQKGGETLRVSVDLLNHLMNLAGELVLSRNRLRRTMGALTTEHPQVAVVLQEVSRVTSLLQEGIMRTRLQPLSVLFGRYPRVLRDLSRSLGKQIELEVTGGEVELDKSIAEALADPLTHLLRNCADHALESAEERVRAGKSPVGRVRIRAMHQGGQVHVEVADDGRGIDLEAVLARAVEKGLVSAGDARNRKERDILSLIFLPGFSTAKDVSAVSGRGVGMDVVRSNVEHVGGTVEVTTERGKGTTFTLRLPLTVAIVAALAVGASGRRFALPQVSVVELVRIKAADVVTRIERVCGALVLRLRESLLPLVRLTDVFGLQATYKHPKTGERLPDRRVNIADRRSGEASAAGKFKRGPDRRKSAASDLTIVVVRSGPNEYGILVEEVFDIEEIVVKPLADALGPVPCFSGATIDGDGRVVMVADVVGISTLAGLRFDDIEAEERRRREEAALAVRALAERKKKILLVDGAPEERFALEQGALTRIERIRAAQIQRVGGSEHIDFRGHVLRVVRLESGLPVRPIPADCDELYLLIPKGHAAGADRAGVLVSRVRDALESDVEWSRAVELGPSAIGAALIDGVVTTLIDPQILVQAGAAQT